MHKLLITAALLLLAAPRVDAATDTTPAASFTITGTTGMDTVTVSDGPGGTTTISSPTFESVTFANKTSVVFDGLGGGDTVTFDNPNPAAGLVSLVVTNVATVDQSAPIAYDAFGVNATGAVLLENTGNDVDRLEISTRSGGIRVIDADDLTLGGVSASLAGVRVLDAGRIRIEARGPLTLADTDAPEIVRGAGADGDVHLFAAGSASDITVAVDRDAVTAPSGQIIVDAGRDVLLGTAGPAFGNDVRAGRGAQLSAVRRVSADGTTRVAADDFGLNSAGLAAMFASHVAGELHVGAGASIGSSGASGGVLLSGQVPMRVRGSIFSASGNILFQDPTDVTIEGTASISAPLGMVRILANAFDLGSASDAAPAPLVEVSDAELDRIAAPLVELSAGNGITVSQPITFTTGAQLALRFWSLLRATGGGSLSAQTLTLGHQSFQFAAMTWDITPSSVRVNGDAPVPYSGATTLNVLGGRPFFGSPGHETFLVTPSATTIINIDGNEPLPPASPGDTLDFDLTGVAAPVLTVTTRANGSEGSLSSANRAPVNFTEIETIADAPPPQPPGLVLTKSAPSAVVYPNGTAAFTITLRNASATTKTNVSWTDVLPGNATFVSVDAPPGYTCTGGSTVTCTTAALAPSATPDAFTVVVQLRPTVLPGHTVVNNVQAASNGALEGTATATAIVSALPAGIPTLSQWMLLLLAAAVAFVALRRF